MIRNKPKSSTSSISSTRTEHILFFNNHVDTSESPTSECFFTSSKNTSTAITRPLSVESHRTSTSTSTMANDASTTHWEVKLSFPCLNYARQSSGGLRADDVQEAKQLICNWERSRQGKIASFYSVFFIESMQRNHEYHEINRLLLEIEVSELTEWSMIALLRSSFQARRHLPAWSTLRDNVLSKLKNDGKDYNRLLSGLIR